VDVAAKQARYGSYRGSIAGVDLAPLAPNALVRIARHKRWIYASIATDELFAAAAVVRLGYSATAFSYVFDAREGRILAHESVVVPTIACTFSDDPARGVRASLRWGSTRYCIEKDVNGAVALAVRAGLVSMDVTMDGVIAPPPITAIARIDGGLVDVTEKRALMATKGRVRVRSVERSVDGGRGGFDLTRALLGRRTQWRWAYAMGVTDEDVPFGINLVQGFVGEPECALWLGRELIGVGEGRIEAEDGDVPRSWRVTSACGAVALRFVAQDFHREDRQLLVVSSKFVQAVGRFEGVLRDERGRTHAVRRALGVTEEQDTRW
jgi:hypothetical protein